MKSLNYSTGQQCRVNFLDLADFEREMTNHSNNGLGQFA